MNEEELVIAVQEYPNLYNLADPKYHDSICKSNSWGEIGVKMNMPGPECQKKWRSLRECYRKALKGRITKSGQAATKCKTPWRLERQMSFLKPFISERNVQVNNFDTEEDLPTVEVIDDGSSNELEFENTTEIQSRSPENILEASPIAVEVSAESFESDPIPSKKAKIQPKKDKSNTSSKMELWTSNRKLPPTASVLKEWVDLKKSQFERKKSNEIEKKVDHLTRFFQSAEETTRTLPLALQIKVKSQINKILTDAEYESINLPQQQQDSQQYHNQWQQQPTTSSHHRHMNYSDVTPNYSENSETRYYQNL